MRLIIDVDEPTAPSRRNVLPILRRSEGSIWTQVEASRDQLYTAMRKACDDAGYEALVVKSGPHVQPAWVRMESWMPRDGANLSGRATAVITINAKEFHRYPLEYGVGIDERGWSKVYERVVGFTPDHAYRLAQFVLGRGPRPMLAQMRVRTRLWQLWRPFNKLDVLAPDWLRFGPWVLFLAGFLLLVEIRPLAYILLLASLGAWVALKRRRADVLSSGKPRAEPRELIRVDSWQTVVSGLGGEADVLRRRLRDLLIRPPLDGFESRVEKIWDWGLDGIVEREQLVMTLRRGWLFCQIYDYQDELYVGWDAHLNSGQWVEKTVATGIDKQTRALIRVNAVRPGTQPLTDYDMVDLNCLTEWTHARIVALVKRLMAERQIDQEVDFHIIRGERPKTGGEAEKSEKSEKSEKPAEQVRRGITKQIGRLGRTS